MEISIIVLGLWFVIIFLVSLEIGYEFGKKKGIRVSEDIHRFIEKKLQERKRR